VTIILQLMTIVQVVNGMDNVWHGQCRLQRGQI